MGWTFTTDIGAQDAIEWSITEDFDPVVEDSTWKEKPSTINPFAAAPSNTILDFAGHAVEELNMLPEEMNLEPDEIQGDFRDWEIIQEFIDEVE